METEIKEYKECCEILKEIAKILSQPNRKKIIETLYSDNLNIRNMLTLDELEIKTEIPAATLHYHLKKLWEAGFIYKTTEQPIKYGLTDFLSFLKKMVVKSQK